MQFENMRLEHSTAGHIAGPLGMSVTATRVLMTATPRMIRMLRRSVRRRSNRMSNFLYMRSAAIIACTLFDVASGATEELRRFRLGFLIEPRPGFFFVHGTFHLSDGAFEVHAGFL